MHFNDYERSICEDKLDSSDSDNTGSDSDNTGSDSDNTGSDDSDDNDDNYDNYDNDSACSDAAAYMSP
jgi:hypothetical protein